MYKLLLCCRYLRTRWIAMASIVSVTLGVATMIVVNAVMAGFTQEMQSRIHGIISDLVFESNSLSGFPDPQWHMQEIRKVAGDDIDGMTPSVIVPAMLNFQYGSSSITRQITLIGVDEQTHSRVSDFGKYLQHPGNREQLSFSLRTGGFDTRDDKGAEIPGREDLRGAGWDFRRLRERYRKEAQRYSELDEPATAAPDANAPIDPFAKVPAKEEDLFDPEKEQHTGLVMGIALGSVRAQDGSDRFLVLPGSDVQVTLPTAGNPPDIQHENFTLVDFYESKMSEYDSNFVFVPLSKLQELRGMYNPANGIRYATNIQIKLMPGVDLDTVRDKLRLATHADGTAMFPPELYSISTWRDKQGPLLAAVQMETAVLNILLFLIIAVAGFGILAIFFMIVVEKVRDIGILKSLGASRGGIMGIFLGYGLSLGIVGAGVGLVLGLLFVHNINHIRAGLEWVTGQPVFDPSIYYFYQIPTIINPFTVTWIVLGALVIAILASILPAMRAARLHPVEALRYE